MDGHWKFCRGRGSQIQNFLREGMKLTGILEWCGFKLKQTNKKCLRACGYFLEPQHQEIVQVKC